MSTESVLDALREVFAERKRRDNPGLSVVPILVDDLAADLPLIESIVKHAGGFVIDPTAAPDLEFRPVLAAAVETELHMLRPGGHEASVVVETGPPVAIRLLLDGVTMPMPTSAFSLLGTTVGFLFSKQLAASRVAVLAYSEATLDIDGRRAIWRLVTHHLDGLAVGDLDTLLVLIGITDVDPDRHLQAGPAASVRYRIRAGNCEKRKKWTADADAIRQVSLEDGIHVLFLGAGFSFSSGLPLGNELRDHALRRLVGTGLEDAQELAQRFHTLVEQNGRLLPEEQDQAAAEFAAQLTLERVLLEEFRLHGHDKSPTLQYLRTQDERAVRRKGLAARKLTEIINSRRKIVILTVNFDRLIEFDNDAAVRVFARDDDWVACADYLSRYRAEALPVPVLKLHGSIDQLDSIVATVDRTSLGLAKERADLLRSLLDSSTPTSWTYIGYSMRDLDLGPVLALSEFARDAKERWVSPFPQATVEEFANRYRRRHWETGPAQLGYSERVITETADTFLDQLSALWATTR
ncbi:MAG: SIR2 family protein [Candidatus Limnocylindrales bacterium]